MIIEEEIIDNTKVKFYDDYIDNNRELIEKNLEILIQKMFENT